MYTPAVLSDRTYTAQMLHELNLKDTADDRVIQDKIRRIQKSENIELDEMQQKAVAEAVKNGLLIVTGGPGIGKDYNH